MVAFLCLTGADQWRIVLLTLYSASVCEWYPLCDAVGIARYFITFIYIISHRSLCQISLDYISVTLSTSKHLRCFWYLLMKTWTLKSHVRVYIRPFIYYIDFSQNHREILLISYFYASKTLSMTVPSLFLNEGSNILKTDNTFWIWNF